ncbi:hypothetical protein SAMN06265784_102386 [Paraburkholderia susongensis]|uniref:Uncharacterized protein n=1 Tax=Paraburkholderia susongensis TaxID=1515439 RepID=A0A1X7JA46_9BURK|nr:hypothetical protein SAMN06265784_102386 [Paraburkholderia susongensis]
MARQAVPGKRQHAFALHPESVFRAIVTDTISR